MEKKYFSKYLSVEGEIKPNDKIYWTDPEGLTSSLNTAIEVSEDMIFMSEPEASETEALPSECKKVKLFLCIKAIKVGYKIIGEISKDALSYIKEGDEFGEEDISTSAFIKSIEPLPEFGALGKNYVLIKGPCGHFH